MNYNNTLYYGVSKTQIGTYSQIQSVSSIANNALNIANNANANANTKVKMEIVSYVGNGTYGAANPCHIVSDFPIGMALYLGYRTSGAHIYYSFYLDAATNNILLFTNYLTTSYVYGSGFWSGTSLEAYGKKNANNTEIWWYMEDGHAGVQLNYAGREYFFLLIEK